MIVGLHGVAGVGKDLIYERIKSYDLLIPVERRAFADKMKESIVKLTGVSYEYLEKAKRLDEPFIKVRVSDRDWRVFTARTFLERYGSEAHRQVFGYHFWIDETLPLPHTRHVNDVARPQFDVGRLVVVTDVRLDNEAMRIRELGGAVWHITREDCEPDGHHETTRGINPHLIDNTIENTMRDDFSYLDTQIRAALNKMHIYQPSRLLT